MVKIRYGCNGAKTSPTDVFNAIISGWLIATMVWMFPAAGAAKIVVIIPDDWLIALGITTHIVVGSVEISIRSSMVRCWGRFLLALRYRHSPEISAAVLFCTLMSHARFAMI